MKDKPAPKRSRLKVAAQIGFYCHLTAYVLVNLMLVVLNLLTTPGRLWCLWSISGWGIGVICHAISVYSGPTRMPRLAQLRAQRQREQRKREKKG